ncbi:hypothetical protein MMPV_007848 [Pyropia vietnamensis]
MASPSPPAVLGRLILGSSSPSRRSILAAMGHPDPLVRPAGIDEKAIRAEDPRELVSALAHAKADAVLASLAADPPPPLPSPTDADGRRAVTLLLTGDQVVVHEGRVREKPLTPDDVREYVTGYASAPAVTIGATVVTDVATGRRWEGADRAEVHLRPLPAEAITALIEDGAVFGCAGALMVEHPIVAPYVERMVGDDTAVRGLCATTTRGLIDAALRGEGGILPPTPAAGYGCPQ